MAESGQVNRSPTDAVPLTGDTRAPVHSPDDTGFEASAHGTSELSKSLDAEATDAAAKRPAAASSVASSSEQPFDCSICFEVPLEDPVVTMCGHLFCWSCLHRWMAQHATCPVCKSLVDRERVIPLYGRGRTREDVSDAPKQQTKVARPKEAIPPRPAARRVEPPPQTANGALPPLRPGAEHLSDWNVGVGAGSFMPYGTAGGISFTPFGLFPSIFGVQFTFPPQPPTGAPSATSSTAARVNPGDSGAYGGVPVSVQAEDATQAMVSRMLLMLGMFVIMCLLLF